MSKSHDPLHPTAQHLKRVAIAVIASYTSGRPATSLINNVKRALNSPQSISHAVPKGVNDASVWSMIAKPFIQGGARRVGFVTIFGAVFGEGKFGAGMLA